ncbi:MAG: CocE/NonD family hydrolase [Rhizomicrobium sp.]|jgi:putative CocE/NonD family hydrolase
MLSHLLSRLWKLPAATNRVDCSRAVPVAMRDGVTLLTDIYRPRGASDAPAVLIRSPYGRGSLFGPLARLYAERGYITLIQSVRGTFGSGGKFDPFFQERDDGIDTVDWIEKQDWYRGKLGLTGPSYLGQVQWAIAAELGDRISAMSVIISTSDFHSAIFDGGSFRLEDFLKWSSLVATQEKTSSLIRALKERLFGDPLKTHSAGLPLRTLDRQALGVDTGYWQTWLDHGDMTDPFWRPIEVIAKISQVTAPVSMVAGWSDVFIRYQVRDFNALRTLGKTARLTVGPWAHTDFRALAEGVRDSLDWFDLHLKGRAAKSGELDRVRLWVNGPNEWRDSDEWPKTLASPLQMYLGADGQLSAASPRQGDRTFTYDPSDPTPSLEGAKLTSKTGRGDTRALSSRSDVLAFDGPVLDAPLELIADAAVTLTISATSPHHDIFVCLCDVEPSGHAINITDGIRRLSGAAGDAKPRTVTIELLPSTWRIPAGHRLRLLVAAGAFPRYARNLGLGEPIGSGTASCKVDITVHCGGEDPSRIATA